MVNTPKLKGRITEKQKTIQSIAPKIPCTAPTKHQLHDILWAEVAKWRTPAIQSEIEWTQEKLYMKSNPENWFAVPRTATQPDALQGFHADHLLYIIDEASRS